MSDPALLVAAPMRLEARALRAGGVEVVCVGTGPRRAGRAVAGLLRAPVRAVAIAGFCGALDGSLAPGDVVVASALVGPDGARHPLVAEPLCAVLARRGVRARVAPVLGVERVAFGRARSRLRDATGALAVDMESFWLAPGAGARPLAVLRVVTDGPRHEFWRPALPLDVLRAWRALRAAAPALADWAREASSR